MVFKKKLTNALNEILETSEQHPPIRLTMTLRDFRQASDIGGFPDFENLNFAEPGITRQYLTYGINNK